MHGILDVNVDVTLGNANVVWFKVHAILYRMYVVPEACKFPLQASNYDNYVRTEWRSEDGWIGWIPSEVRHACSLATAHSLQGLCVLGQKCFWWLVVSCSSIQFGQEYRQSQLMLAVSVASGNIFSISYKILEHHSGAIDVTWPRDQEQHSLWQTNLVGKCCQLLACAANMFKFLHPFKILFQPIESTCSLHVMKRFSFWRSLKMHVLLKNQAGIVVNGMHQSSLFILMLLAVFWVARLNSHQIVVGVLPCRFGRCGVGKANLLFRQVQMVRNVVW